VSAARHAHDDGARRCVRVAVVTVSDTRTEADDASGAAIVDLLRGAGHAVTERRILPDDPDAVRGALIELLHEPDCEAVLVNGGTGIARRDTTYEAVAGLLDKRLDGFGELFRSLSFAEIGSAAMISRAVGGVASGRLLFSMPGSTAAVRLAMERLILPELAHLIRELEK
jgi:molybdenum cofactor biosynthesis protein B